MVKEVKIEIFYELRSEEDAKNIYMALEPEFKRGFPGIKKSSLELNKNELRILIQGESVSRVRAIMNTLTRWLISIENLNDTIGK